MAALQPPLSYSLPAFSTDGYNNVGVWLENLRDLQFRWVTFHPTWLVYDETPPRIRPDAPDVLRAVRYARELGLKTQLEPHLDWESTLTGGPYDWRRRMILDPTGAYFDLVIGPMAALQPDRLTLGSELDVSVYRFTTKWIQLAAKIRDIAIGHKLNHDAFERENGFQLREYLRQLTYVAFSFYPKIEFEDAAGDLVRGLREIAGPGPEFAIGEFGLGCTDLRTPWRFEAASFQTPEHFAIRRDYYLRFLQWIAAQPYTGSPVTFWTAGHYDFLGVLEQRGLRAFRDETLRDAVAEYNRFA